MVEWDIVPRVDDQPVDVGLAFYSEERANPTDGSHSEGWMHILCCHILCNVVQFVSVEIWSGHTTNSTFFRRMVFYHYRAISPLALDEGCTGSGGLGPTDQDRRSRP
ncbi:hypothetical protein RSOLAG22IIIB_06330 [Rhizoctonia solani]|uniref:Uncharacterized protein n=1 Tax=Rhizoctonia solani TaxID=456999 RepID=A0A0K6GDI1_9AGAM|nr:hypothetical protein RSOLAG22IIIB_06330 [Rhizoctonia solani]